ncbi:nucleotidyltransferase domain-containing protein [Bradyrhizobium sp.]|uniref:nucleotidyltransferase domain-containing protein n=1 Tax=Bradyrhizobium sp. TaxID=376 RepID=UPI003C6FB223
MPALADVPDFNAIVLGGSRARGTATENSDCDFGLYHSEAKQLDAGRLLEAVRNLIDEPDAIEVNPGLASGALNRRRRPRPSISMGNSVQHRERRNCRRSRWRAGAFYPVTDRNVQKSLASRAEIKYS